jgi:hypothetical protein
MEIFNTKVIITVVIYSILLFWLGFSLYAEYKDIHCQDAKGRVCGAGCGRAYSTFKADKNDSKEELFEKLRLTAKYELNTITWRRSFILALILAFLILFITTNQVPSGVKLSKGFLIAYVVIYLSLTTFQTLITRPALKQLEEILQRIRTHEPENN